MCTRDRVGRLVSELPQAPQYPTQGATLFVDLERREVRRGYTPMRVVHGLLPFVDAVRYVGLDNIDLRQRIPNDFGGTWTRDLAMVNITRAGENLVLTSAIMAGPKACYARGGPGAKMGSLKLKAIVVQGQTRDFETAQPYKGYNRTIAQKLLDTSVVKHALKTTGTPFLYKPSRMLGAMGTKNHQE